MHPYIPDVREVLERKDRPVLGDANLEDLVFTIYSRLWEKWRITTWIPFISFTRSFLKLDGFCLFVLSVWLVGCFSGQWGRGEGFFSAHDPIGRDLHLPVLIFLLALDYTQTSLRLFLCPCTGRFEYKSFLWAFAWLTLCSSSQLFFFFCFLWTSGFKIFHEILYQISLFKFAWHQYFFSLLPEFPHGSSELLCFLCIKKWGQLVSDQARVFSILIYSFIYYFVN